VCRREFQVPWLLNALTTEPPPVDPETRNDRPIGLSSFLYGNLCFGAQTRGASILLEWSGEMKKAVLLFSGSILAAGVCWYGARIRDVDISAASDAAVKSRRAPTLNARVPVFVANTPEPNAAPTVAVQVEPPVPPKPEPTTGDTRAFLQSYFVAQKVDPTWAGAAGRELGDDLGRLKTAGVRLNGVECRSTICRAELVAPSADAAMEFGQSYLRERTSTSAGFLAMDEVNPDGSRKLLVFLARTDTQLPTLE
jgi:hypothetical protein